MVDASDDPLKVWVTKNRDIEINLVLDPDNESRAAITLTVKGDHSSIFNFALTLFTEKEQT